jgi:hypothetical protein
LVSERRILSRPNVKPGYALLPATAEMVKELFF